MKNKRIGSFVATVAITMVAGLSCIQAQAAEYMLCSTKDKKLSVSGEDNPVLCEMKYNRGDITASIVKPLSELHNDGWRIAGMTQGTSYTVMFLLIKDSSK